MFVIFQIQCAGLRTEIDEGQPNYLYSTIQWKFSFGIKCAAFYGLIFLCFRECCVFEYLHVSWELSSDVDYLDRFFDSQDSLVSHSDPYTHVRARICLFCALEIQRALAQFEAQWCMMLQWDFSRHWKIGICHVDDNFAEMRLGKLIAAGAISGSPWFYSHRDMKSHIYWHSVIMIVMKNNCDQKSNHIRSRTQKNRIEICKKMSFHWSELLSHILDLDSENRAWILSVLRVSQRNIIISVDTFVFRLTNNIIDFKYKYDIPTWMNKAMISIFWVL